MYALFKKLKKGTSAALLSALSVMISSVAVAQDAAEGSAQAVPSQTEASVSASTTNLTASTSTKQNKSEQQDKPSSKIPSFFKPVVGNLYFLGGVGFHDVEPLNSRLDDAGFSESGNPALTLGIGGDMSIGRLILGTEWHRVLNVGSEVERNGFRADISSKMWLGRLGIDVAKWKGLRVYPLFGIGTGKTTIRISQEQGANFDDVLATPARSVKMTQKGLLLDATLGIDYRFKVRENDYKTRFFTVGVRGGYLFSPYSRGWETASAEISGGPDISMSGPTAQLLIGFSGQHKKPYYKRHHHRKQDEKK